jgi:hypothetical protein
MMFCVNDNEMPENPQPAEPAESTPPAPDHTAAGEGPPTPTAAVPAAPAAVPDEPNVPAAQPPSTQASPPPVPHEPTVQPPAPPVAPPTQPASYPAQASQPLPAAARYAGAGGHSAPDAAAQAGHPGAPQHFGAPQNPGAPHPAGHPGAPEHFGPPQNPGGPLDPAAPPHDFGPNKKLTKGAWIGIIAGVVVVLLVLAAIIVIPLISRGSAGSGGGGSDDGGSAADAASTPAEYVEEYLTAVAEGDAETALEYVDAASYNDDLLTDDVLQASLELGAIDDIEVGKAKKPKDEYDPHKVPVTFTVGGEEVSTEYEVYVSSYDGEMTMYDGFVSISTYGFEGMGLTANGVEVPEETTVVFPGTYELALGIEGFTIDGGTTFVLAKDDDADALYDARPVLSEDGVAKYRELVSASLRECLAMKTLSTPCGMDVSQHQQDGYTPIDGTVTRTLTAEGESALAALHGEVSDRAVVSSFEAFNTDISLEAQNASGSRASFTVLFGAGLLTPKVDFAAEELAVVWE